MQNNDLRLLSVFHEIYKTGSVSRAADKLGLGQPAVSIALGKLREHYKDPLFVRCAKGMVPTPLGDELLGPVRSAIDALELALGYCSEFDPAESERSFRLAMTDISQLVLLPRLLGWLREAAPNVVLEVAALSPDTARQLEEGDVDVALGFMPELEAGFFQQSLFRQRYACLASAKHPRVRDGLDLAAFEYEDHAVVTTSGTGHLIVDREVDRQHIQRRVALRIPSFIGVAFVVESTDLLVTVPERVGQLLAGRGAIRMFEAPFELPDYAVKQHWHERFHHDPGNRWLRNVVWELLSEG